MEKENIYEDRNEKYEDILKEDSKSKIIFDQKISIRKQKKNEVLMAKRNKELTTKKKYEYIHKIDLANLPKDLLQIYNQENKSNTKLNITKYFDYIYKIKAQKFQETYFILDRLYVILSTLDENKLFKIIDDLNLGHKLFDLFEIYPRSNKIHEYQTFKILVNISMKKNKDTMSKLVNPTSIKFCKDRLLALFENIIENSEIICQIILFLMNLLEDNSYIQYVYYQFYIYELLYMFILNNKSPKNNNNEEDDKKLRQINRHIVTFFSLFIAVNFDENEQIFIDNKEKILNELYNLFEYFLMNNYGDKDLVLDCVWGLSNILTQFNEEDTFIDSLIDKYFQYIIPNLYQLILIDNNDYRVPIFRVIGNLTSLKDIYCQRFFIPPWSEFLLKLLENNLVLPKYKILIIWILHNVCAGTNFECLKLYNCEKILINALKNENNLDVIYYLLKLFYGIIKNSKKNFLNDELFDCIIEIIKKNLNLKINFVCSFLCEKIYEANIQKYIDKLNDIGFKEILENWALSENDELKLSAEYILNKYYNNNHI